MQHDATVATGDSKLRLHMPGFQQNYFKITFVFESFVQCEWVRMHYQLLPLANCHSLWYFGATPVSTAPLNPNHHHHYQLRFHLFGRPEPHELLYSLEADSANRDIKSVEYTFWAFRVNGLSSRKSNCPNSHWYHNVGFSLSSERAMKNVMASKIRRIFICLCAEQNSSKWMESAIHLTDGKSLRVAGASG